MALACLHAGDNDWWGKHKIYIGEHTPPGESSSYSELLASSTFCFAIMGDGFSSRFEDGLLHGWVWLCHGSSTVVLEWVMQGWLAK